MRKIVIISLLLVVSAFAQTDQLWTGYVQVRYSDNLYNVHSFKIRRIKLWSYHQTPFSEHLYYKVQAIFRYPVSGALVLQDAFAEYRAKNWRLRVGQEVPQFSLQRAQPDYVIPLIERARIVDALIPAAETGARDIGMQVIVKPDSSLWTGAFGVFNGNGANVKGNEDRWFLLTTRQILKWRIQKQISLQVGASFSYRETSGLHFLRILGADTLFQGKDIRAGAELRLTLPFSSLQAEYIQAKLGTAKAYGYYVLLNIPLTEKHWLTLEMEQYKDLNPVTCDEPWMDVGYSFLYHSHKAKLMLDLRAQLTNPKPDYRFATQIQLFFN